LLSAEAVGGRVGCFIQCWKVGERLKALLHLGQYSAHQTFLFKVSGIFNAPLHANGFCVKIQGDTSAPFFSHCVGNHL
jgi:hypothetical protein